MVFFHVLLLAEISSVVDIMIAWRFAIRVHVGSVKCCQEGLRHVFVEKQAYRRSDRVVWMLSQPVLRFVGNFFLVGCITAKRAAMLVIVHLAQ